MTHTSYYIEHNLMLDQPPAPIRTFFSVTEGQFGRELWLAAFLVAQTNSYLGEQAARTLVTLELQRTVCFLYQQYRDPFRELWLACWMAAVEQWINCELCGPPPKVGLA